jgi:hypothetical protein
MIRPDIRNSSWNFILRPLRSLRPFFFSLVAATPPLVLRGEKLVPDLVTAGPR